MSAKEKLQERLAAMTAGELVEILQGLNEDLRPEADTVYEMALEALEPKVSEERYVQILEAL